MARTKGLRKVQPHRAATSPFYAEHAFPPLLAGAFVGATLQDSISRGAVCTLMTRSNCRPIVDLTGVNKSGSTSLALRARR